MFTENTHIEETDAYTHTEIHAHTHAEIHAHTHIENTRIHTYTHTHTHISIHNQLPKLQGFIGAGVESENEHRAVYTFIRRMLVEFVMEMLNEALDKRAGVPTIDLGEQSLQFPQDERKHGSGIEIGPNIAEHLQDRGRAGAGAWRLACDTAMPPEMVTQLLSEPLDESQRIYIVRVFLFIAAVG